jgi:hypothetical protein
MDVSSDKGIKEDGWILRNIKKICAFFSFKKRNEPIPVKTLDDTMPKAEEP